VDTLYWVALTNSRDQWHERAKNIQDSLVSCKLITTEAVLIEYLNYFSLFNSLMRQTVAGITDDILGSAEIEVLPVTHELFLSGLALYAHRPDKGYSMVDCISMSVMRDRNLLEVLTHDRHFAQEGFSILL
jgi:predicted nucleic acid-binding protein